MSICLLLLVCGGEADRAPLRTQASIGEVIAHDDEKMAKQAKRLGKSG